MASMDVDFDSLEARESDIAASAAHPETARLLSELDRRQLARKIALPTNDGEVRARLRELDEPVTLFGAVFSNLSTFTNLGSQIGDTRAISAVRFSPDSSMLLTGSWTGQAKLWSVPSCKEVRVLKAHKERIGGVAWHPEATLSQSASAVNFATSGADNDVKLWNLESDTSLRTLSGHESRVCRVNFHPSGRYLGSASYDGTWRLWDVERGDELLLQEGHSKEVYAIAFQGDGALVASGGLDAIARVWDLRSGRTALVLSGHSRDILSIDFSPNGYQVATGSNDDTIRVWDLRMHQAIATIPGHKSAISDVKFFHAPPSRDRERYPLTEVPRAFDAMDAFSGAGFGAGAGAGANGEAKKEEGEGTSEEAKPDVYAPGDDSRPDFPVSGSFLVSSGFDGYVKVWSADDWQQVRAMANDEAGKVMSVDVSSDARFIAAGQYDKTFKLYSDPNVDLA
ncbi:U4/U6 snRNP-specific spliceosomal protein [Rhodotorula diobovata]|uniref:U4/U6 snRNP-specific spliceosomal protein n=1 Tax=Rhodotorula diobovata TaxID=5288 RepID=A0A5C5G2D7_9BASI|nr:U4/U6 snRNP-specific spliceosomal protein [Rhodotorula diobovata]